MRHVELGGSMEGVSVEGHDERVEMGMSIFSIWTKEIKRLEGECIEYLGGNDGAK